MKPSKFILPTIVFSQFCCTSLWFAGNGVMGDLMVNFNFDERALGHLTSAVQLGFILGTLVFAIFTISDRFSPSIVFFSCAILGALFNFGVIWEGNGLASIFGLRLLTGFFLAGIYPVGMKIASDYYDKGLGKSLGFLVGALVLGTAFPHLAKDMTGAFPWKAVLILTSSLAAVGGLLMYLLVPDGPFRKPGLQVDLSAFFGVFRDHKFRSAAFGYFGHMWELYAFWAFVPIILKTYNIAHPETTFNIPLWSFFIIGIGGLACVLGGYLATPFGTKRVAFLALLLSGGCCIVSPVVFAIELESVFIGFLLFWGMVVIADSPLFSTLVAQNASPEIKGTALTIVNCVGFSITIISIQLLNALQDDINPRYLFTLLAIGPMVGLMALGRVQMKKRFIYSILIISCGALILSISSCDDQTDCCTIIDVDVQIYYKDQSGENLINSADEFKESNIKIYYKNGEQYDYIFNGNLDYPNMHSVRASENGNLILTVFPSNFYEGDQSTTLIELNPNIIDTLICEFELESNKEICKRAWLNGIEMNNRYIEVIK